MLCPPVPVGNVEHPGPILAQMMVHKWHHAGAMCLPIPIGNAEHPSPIPGDSVGTQSLPDSTGNTEHSSPGEGPQEACTGVQHSPIPLGNVEHAGPVTECRRLWFEVLLFHVTCSPRAWVSPARPGRSQRCTPKPQHTQGKSNRSPEPGLGMKPLESPSEGQGAGGPCPTGVWAVLSWSRTGPLDPSHEGTQGSAGTDAPEIEPEPAEPGLGSSRMGLGVRGPVRGGLSPSSIRLPLPCPAVPRAAPAGG